MKFQDKMRRMRKDARHYMSNWPIDWTMYQKPRLLGGFYDNCVDIEWTPKKKYETQIESIRLNSAWINSDTGEIAQAGTSYGILSL